jgi:hypothetical protein
VSAGIKPINTLSVGWTADQMLALYRLTGNTTYLQQGELVLGAENAFFGAICYDVLLETINLDYYFTTTGSGQT